MSMENFLKERLVGAVVLVFAAVIFIPLVLDGPDTDAKVSQSVALPERTDADRRTIRIDLNPGDAQRPVRPAEPAAVDLTSEQQGRLEAAPEIVPDSGEPEPAEAGRAARGVPQDQDPAPQQETASAPVANAPWTVQVGSFSQDSNAESLAAKLRELGYPAYVSRFDDGEQLHHRVRVGGFATRESAQARADEIRASTQQPARPARNR